MLFLLSDFEVATHGAHLPSKTLILLSIVISHAFHLLSNIILASVEHRSILRMSIDRVEHFAICD